MYDCKEQLPTSVATCFGLKQNRIDDATARNAIPMKLLRAFFWMALESQRKSMGGAMWKHSASQRCCSETERQKYFSPPHHLIASSSKHFDSF